MLRNLIRHGGSGSFQIFISARGNRWFNITLRHRCCRGVILLTFTFHSFISFSSLGLTLNSWVLDTTLEHPEMRSIIDTYGWLPTKHDVKDIIKTFEDYLQVLQTKTSRHQNVNDLEIIYYLRFA